MKNPIKSFINYMKDRRLERLKKDLLQLSFDPSTVYLPKITNKIFSQRIAENFAWYSASTKNLEEFYSKSNNGSDRFFWKMVKPTKHIRLHSGIPSLISDRMATLIHGAGYEVIVEVTDKDGNINEALSEKKTKRLIDILEDNNIESLLKYGASSESWCGHLFAKLSIDTKLTKYPIIEFFDLRSASVVLNRGRVVQMIFKDYITKGDDNYIHYEIMGTDDSGVAIIEHSLYKIDNDNEKELPLDYLPETSDLEPIYRFDGIQGILAVDKPNKIPNNEFPDSYYGASDYSGAYSSFDALDETYSEIFSEARRNKTIRYIPKSFIPPEGFKNDFTTDYVEIDSNKDQNAVDKIDITVIPDKTDDHVKKWNTALTTAINMAGLSPITLGITGLTAIDSSDKTLRERQKTSLETRQAKVRLWKTFLEKLYTKVILLDEWINKDPISKDQIRVKVAFNDYVSNTFDERLAQVGGAVLNNIMSIEMAVDYLYMDELTPEAKEKECERLLFRRGLVDDAPELMQLGQLNDTERN